MRAHGVERVVYLSGLVPDVADDELSEHITSRREVEQILTDAPATVVALRAAVLLGSGSTSFEIIRQVSERMPVHTIPTWMDSMVQPIAIVDVLEALVGALDYDGPSRHFDVGGPEQLRYGALLEAYTSHAGLDASSGRRAAAADGSRRHPGRQPHRRAPADGRGAGREPAPRHGVGGRRLPATRCSRRGTSSWGWTRPSAARSLRSASEPDDADPMGPLPQDPVWASGGDERPVVAKVVDAVKDVLPGA